MRVPTNIVITSVFSSNLLNQLVNGVKKRWIATHSGMLGACRVLALKRDDNVNLALMSYRRGSMASARHVIGVVENVAFHVTVDINGEYLQL